MGRGIKGIIGRLRDSVRKLSGRNVEEGSPAEEVHAPRLSDEAAELLQSLCGDLGPRPAASEMSAKAAERIRDEFLSFTDDAAITSGSIVPERRRWMLLSLMVSAVLVLAFSIAGLPYLAMIPGLMYLYAFFSSFRRRSSFLDRLFPSSEAVSVHAVIEPYGSVERTLVLSAHHDSAPVQGKRSGFLSRFSDQGAAISFAVLLASAAMQCIAELFQGRFLRPNMPPLLFLLVSVASFAAAAVSFISVYCSDERYSPGAGDNLSGVAAIAALGRHFSREKKSGRGLGTTRLVFVSFDGEECGAAGSRVWIEENRDLLLNPVMLNFDGLYKPEDLVFLSSDGNGFIPLSSELAARCSALSDDMGYRIPVVRIGLFGGETDAAAAACAGIPATTLTAAAPGTETPAHTDDDTPDKVSPEALSRAISIAIKLAASIDRKAAEKKDDSGLFSDGRKYRLSRY